MTWSQGLALLTCSAPRSTAGTAQSGCERESVSQSSLSPRGCPAPRQYVAQRSSEQAHQTFPYISQRALPQGGCSHLLPSDPAPWAPCRRLAQAREATEPWMLCQCPGRAQKGFLHRHLQRAQPHTEGISNPQQHLLLAEKFLFICSDNTD